MSSWRRLPLTRREDMPRPAPHCRATPPRALPRAIAALQAISIVSGARTLETYKEDLVARGQSAQRQAEVALALKDVPSLYPESNVALKRQLSDEGACAWRVAHMRCRRVACARRIAWGGCGVCGEGGVRGRRNGTRRTWPRNPWPTWPHSPPKWCLCAPASRWLSPGVAGVAMFQQAVGESKFQIPSCD